MASSRLIYIYQTHARENLILAFIRELYDNSCCKCDGARSGAFCNCATVSLLRLKGHSSRTFSEGMRHTFLLFNDIY